MCDGEMEINIYFITMLSFYLKFANYGTYPTHIKYIEALRDVKILYKRKLKSRRRNLINLFVQNRLRERLLY